MAAAYKEYFKQNRATKSSMAPKISLNGKAKLPPILNQFEVLRNPSKVLLEAKPSENVAQAEKKPRKVKVYQKTSYHQKNFKPRMTAIVEMVRQIDAELDKELGKSKKPMRTASFNPQFVRGDHKSLFCFLQEKKAEFYGNYLTSEMKLEIGKLKREMTDEESKLESRANKLQEHAMLFQEFVKTVNDRTIEAKKEVTFQAKKHLEVKQTLKDLQEKSVFLKSKITHQDELLMHDLDYKSFILKVFHNSRSKTNHNLLQSMWEQHRKTGEYTGLETYPPVLYPVEGSEENYLESKITIPAEPSARDLERVPSLRLSRLSSNEQMGRFSRIAKQILQAERVSTFMRPPNHKMSTLEVPDAGNDAENSAPVGSGSNRLAAPNSSRREQKKKQPSAQKLSTATLSSRPSQRLTRGVNKSRSVQVSKASTSNTFLRRKFVVKEQSTDSSCSIEEEFLEEEEAPAPYVLNFLYSNDVKTTKTKYAEEWVSNTKFAESETEKIASVLNDPDWLLSIMENLEEVNVKFISHFQATDKQYEEIKKEKAAAEQELNTEIKMMQEEISYLTSKIQDYETQAKNYENLYNSIKFSNSLKPSNGILEKTMKSLGKVYKDVCEDLETMRDDPVGMLTKIELQCTEYFDFMDSQPDALVRKMLKILEKERRAKVIKRREDIKKDERLKKDKREKVKKNIRWVAVKRRGHPLCPRSAPTHANMMKEMKQKQEEAEEDLDYFFK